MKIFVIFCVIFILSYSAKCKVIDEFVIVDHNCTNLFIIPVTYIELAKQNLIVAYGHTSHGSQITTGMSQLDNFTSSNGFKRGLFDYNNQGSNNALKFYDTPFKGAEDLGNPDFTSWESATRNYLNAHSEVNVVMWSWCGQAGWASVDDINTYLNLMNSLENDFNEVRFVYMTGHLDGSGADGTLNRNNNLIRTYCIENGKILYDFADIESFDPEGAINYMELFANDNCDYLTSEGIERNWAIDWQNKHTENVDWYNCSVAHSQALNGNRKAFAAWWLFATLAGWQFDSSGVNSFSYQNINESLISWIDNGYCVVKLPFNLKVKTVCIYNRLGQLLLKQKPIVDSNTDNKLLINLLNLLVNTQNNLLFLQIESEKGTFFSKVSLH